ncbi:MAG TPA: PQQ-binding-like beta-propeller repeat protein [Bacteroidales bacterium]|nr:PQQ-binding-like beta-propeller repeat protein [Bacteroidales bacterium]
MKTIKLTTLIITGLFVYTGLFAQVTSQWRGENRDGIYKGTNLMTKWPEKGPSLLWSVENIGEGYSCPVAKDEFVVVNGSISGTGFLFTFNTKGELLWKSPYGPEYPQNDTSSEKYSGPRSTPTIAGDLVYICSGMGRVSCFDLRKGSEVWSVDMMSQFNGLMHAAGYGESLLVDGDVVYCHPGGTENNVAALNRLTGKTIWTSKGTGDSVSFCSPVVVNLPGRKVIVTLTHKYFSGIDAATGELLWSREQNQVLYNNQFATPVCSDGCIYYISESGSRLTKLELAADGKSVQEKWRLNNVRSGLHSPVKMNDMLYYSDVRQKIRGIDINSGKVTDSLRVFRGPVLAADNKLFSYSENGTVSLISLEGSKMSLISSFKIEKGTREHLATPFIDKGVMYIRHGDALMAYDISND